jgi:hypothetical protein
VRYSQVIGEYCRTHGVEVPDGFHRHSASRYAVILEGTPPKLVARTWFKQADVVYYLRHIASGPVREILDFKEGCRLFDKCGARLSRSTPIV